MMLAATARAADPQEFILPYLELKYSMIAGLRD